MTLLARRLVLAAALALVGCSSAIHDTPPPANSPVVADSGPIAGPPDSTGRRSVDAPPADPGGASPAASDVPIDRLLPVDDVARRWVDSVLATLDTRERAAQLVVPWMWGRYVPETSDEWARLRSWVQEAGVGGIITSIGAPVGLGDKLNRLQRLADVPLLIVSDMESGPGMRLDGGTLLPYGVDMGGGTVFPPAMALGATGDPSLAYHMGRITAAEARAVGVHMSFAPVVDVNNNPANPIINVRSYGGDPESVATFAVAQLQGLQDNGMLATAKHFPGHGDVEDDTHLVPLILRISAERADSVELVPYRAAIRAGVAGIMSAHIAFPALAGDSVLPATLSPRMLDSLLVGELGFEGLVVTDALDMGAIVRRFGAGEAATLALEAGADILLQPTDPFVVRDAIVAAVESGRIPPARLERSVRKILEAKTRVGLHRKRTVDIDRIASVVGAAEHREVAATVAERSIALVRDRDALVPLRPDSRVLLVSYTDNLAPFAVRTLAGALRAGVRSVSTVRLGPDNPPESVLRRLGDRADAFDLVIIAASARVRGNRDAAIDAATAEAFRAIARRRPTILVSLRSPYLLQEIPEVGSYLLGWTDADVGQRAVARALLGETPIRGRLPTAIPPYHETGTGLDRGEPTAEDVREGSPDLEPAAAGALSAGLEPPDLDSLSTVIRTAIARGVTPGAAIAVGRSNGPAWTAAFGRTDPEPGAPAVTDSTLFDLASLTKVVGTTTAIMRLVDEGRMELDSSLSRYLPEWPVGGWRDGVTVRRLLTHTAGLAPFLRFWHPSEGGLRGRDAILHAVIAAPPRADPGSRYDYSDLGAILLGAAVEAVTGTSLDSYLAETWSALDMHETTFRPDVRFPLRRIAPTEVDLVYRNVHVHGVVHDENAHAMGGVAGHAGLFSSVRDLARFARSMLVEAVPAEPSTIQRFTTRQPDSERALGWDAAAGTTIAEPFSSSAYGHTGFTGTSLWIDPERDLYVVLLTNRVNPTRDGTGIGALRAAVHRLAVRSVGG